MFCLPNKAASTSISHFFMNNLDTEDQNIWLDSVISESLQQRVLKSVTATRVMVIRHPFRRLISAFHHLFRWGLHQQGFGCARHSQSNNSCDVTANADLADRIVKRLRPESSLALLELEEFAMFLVDRHGQFTLLHREVEERWPGLAAHWRPTSTACSPCSFFPHFLLEVESLTQELPLLLTWSGLERTYGSFPQLPRLNRREGEEVTMEELHPDTVAALADYYREDFLIGGYSPNVP